MSFIIIKSVRTIIIFTVLYAVILIPATYLISQQKSFTESAEQIAVGSNDKPEIVDILVRQLDDNKKGYANNVWTTLATIVGALGMVLGSAKFQEILRTSRVSVIAVQSVLILLYVLHAVAYYFYLRENIEIFEKLAFVVGPLADYYSGYLIAPSTIILNLLFDTVLFVLLACIIDYIGRDEEKL